VDSLPLPPRPDLEQYRKRAKELYKAAHSTDPEAVRLWANEWLGTLERLRGVKATSFEQGSFDRAIELIETTIKATRGGRRFSLGNAQFLIARAHSFKSWRAFADHVEQLSRTSTGDREFESAADAIVSGNRSALAELLRAQPELVRARSTREHQATLLHYVAANGVEDFRQKTPPNAVEIARLLLEAGAKVDALAETYGGGNAQTTMNLLVSSTHPFEAGLQEQLVETLLDHGAAINGVDDDGSPIMTALSFGYAGAAETLGRRGARIGNIAAAAALNRLELVEGFLTEEDTLDPSLTALYWIHVPKERKARIGLALVWASALGHRAIVELLLIRGADPGSRDPSNDMTALHWAAANRQLDIMDVLIAHGAPLETLNTWGGTVFYSTIWMARNGSWFPAIPPSQRPPGEAYLPVLQKLVDAGAKLHEPYDTGIPAINEWLRRYGPAN
jgi:ankyrin repeat protein